MERVCVLMSTYNGEKYLKEQVDSILNQENIEISLWIRDDGSTDKTLSILHEYQKKWENIKVFSGKNVGYINSFMWLVEQCDFEEGTYYAFADQDDIWESIKLIKAVEELKKENLNLPLLYYSDLQVVDENNNFIRYANSWEGTINKYMIAVFIGIRGCTMVFNDVLKRELEGHFVRDISGHDTYIALLAFWIGKVVYDKNAYIHYRQTGNNLSITGVSKADKIRKNILFFKRRISDRKCIHEKNAKELLFQYGERYSIELEELKLVADYRKNIVTKLKLLFCCKFKKHSLLIRVFNDILIILGKL